MFWLGNENEFWFEKRDSKPLLLVLSVVTISFLFQIDLFILWQNSRIVASTLRCSSRIHFSTQSVQNCLLFPSFCEMKHSAGNLYRLQ